MPDCLFCKIIAKQIPSTPVYEDDETYAFLDIHPVNHGHTLVVPKQHSDGFRDATPAALNAVSAAAQKVARALLKAFDTTGFNLAVNDGAIAGQVVGHYHLHVIPRRADDGLTLWHGHEYAPGEAEAIAKKIKANVQP